MTETQTPTAVRRSITVQAPAERAFTVFTAGFDTWWPAEHYIGGAQPQVRTLEQRDGGRWFERAADGSECDWGRVLAWEPPRRLLLSWQIDGTWKHDPDPARGSEVEVTFTQVGPGTTRVDVEHRHLERHGETWRSVLEGVSSPGGWTRILHDFAAAAESGLDE